MTDEPIVFRTATKTKVGDTFVAVLYAISALIFVPVGALVAGAAVIMFAGPHWLALLVGGVTLILAARLAWAGIIEQIRFCVILHPEFLQVGEDISRIDLDYDAIDEVALTNNNTDGVGIGLSARGRDLCVRLPAESAVECFQALLTRCPNAVFTDAGAREYVVPNEEQPEKTLLLIEKHKRKLAFRCLAALPFLCLWVIFRLFMVSQWLAGAIQVPRSEVPEMFIYLALSVLSTLGCLSLASTAFSKARQARVQRLQILGVDDNIAGNAAEE